MSETENFCQSYSSCGINNMTSVVVMVIPGKYVTRGLQWILDCCSGSLRPSSLSFFVVAVAVHEGALKVLCFSYPMFLSNL